MRGGLWTEAQSDPLPSRPWGKSGRRSMEPQAEPGSLLLSNNLQVQPITRSCMLNLRFRVI